MILHIFFSLLLFADNILVTRLQNYFSGHQTTDDTTSNDYDYLLEEDDTNEPTQFTLPLIPILNNQDSHLIAIDKSQEDKIELNKFSFSQNSDPGDQAVLSNDSATINNTSDVFTTDNTTVAFILSTEHDLITDEKNATQEQNKLYESSSIEPENVDQSTTDTIEYETFSDFSYATEMSKDPPSTDLSYDMNEDENYPQTTLGEILIYKSENLEKKPEAGKEINNSSTETRFDDYFETLFKNESLLIDNTSSYENLTEFDYDTATTTQPNIDHLIEESSGDGRVEKLEIATVYEVIRTSIDAAPTVANKIKFEDDQNDAAFANEESEKFVYRTSESVLPSPSSVIRFPESRDGVTEKNQRVRFPDDSSGSQWVRDNGYHLMRFWQEQPLIDDDKAGDYEVLHRRNY